MNIKHEFQRVLEQELNRLTRMVQKDTARRIQILATKHPRSAELELEMREIGVRLTKLNYARTALRQAILAYKKNM